MGQTTQHDDFPVNEPEEVTPEVEETALPAVVTLTPGDEFDVEDLDLEDEEEDDYDEDLDDYDEDLDEGDDEEWDIDEEVESQLQRHDVEFVRFKSTWYNDESTIGDDDIVAYDSNGKVVDLPWDARSDLEYFFWNSGGAMTGVHEYHVPTGKWTALGDTFQDEVWGVSAFPNPDTSGAPEGFRLLQDVDAEHKLMSYPVAVEGEELVELDVFEMIQLGHAAKDLGAWQSAINFTTECYPPSAHSIEFEVDWEYNDQGGNDPYISHISVSDSSGEELNPDYEKLLAAYLAKRADSKYREFTTVEDIINEGNYAIRTIMFDAFEFYTPESTTRYVKDAPPALPFKAFRLGAVEAAKG